MSNKTDLTDDEIDYLHPDGKPLDWQDATTADIQYDNEKRQRKALQEADGHSIKRRESDRFLHSTDD